MQLRLQQGVVTGGRQAPGLPNPWGMRMLEQAAQLQQNEPLIRDVPTESHSQSQNPAVLGGFCVGHMLQASGEGNSGHNRNSSPLPRPVPVRWSHEGASLPEPAGTPTARFPTPTLGDLRGP
eukprot:6301180-Amphidinium_carterae.1